MNLVKSKQRVADHGEVFTPAGMVVPKQEWTKRWTDEDLYVKYGITASEIEFIEKVVRPMELTSDLFGEVAIDESEDE